MLKLTAKKKKWFDVPQDPTGECKVEIVHLKPGELADIEAQANQVVAKQQQGEEFATEITLNPNAHAKKIVTKAIVDWKGFCGPNDKPLKCTDFNKLAVLSEYDWFAAFIGECRAILAEEAEAELEDAEKN